MDTHRRVDERIFFRERQDGFRVIQIDGIIHDTAHTLVRQRHEQFVAVAVKPAVVIVRV